MKFQKWIKDQGGPREVARLLGTSAPTIHHWVKRKNSPKAVVMQELVKLGDGAFSWEDIVNDTKPRSSRNFYK